MRTGKRRQESRKTWSKRQYRKHSARLLSEVDRTKKDKRRLLIHRATGRRKEDKRRPLNHIPMG